MIRNLSIAAVAATVFFSACKKHEQKTVSNYERQSLPSVMNGTRTYAGMNYVYLGDFHGAMERIDTIFLNDVKIDCKILTDSTMSFQMSGHGRTSPVITSKFSPRMTYVDTITLFGYQRIKDMEHEVYLAYDVKRDSFFDILYVEDTVSFDKTIHNNMYRVGEKR